MAFGFTLSTMKQLYAQGWRDFRRATLLKATLVGAEFRGIDLSEANLTDADLTGVNLEGARLVGANLAGAKLDFAKLNCALLEGANLAGAKLERADLRYATFDDRTCFSDNFAPKSFGMQRGHGGWFQKYPAPSQHLVARTEIATSEDSVPPQARSRHQSAPWLYRGRPVVR